MNHKERRVRKQYNNSKSKYQEVVKEEKYINCVREK
jgi:hypothetical protein